MHVSAEGVAHEICCMDFCSKKQLRKSERQGGSPAVAGRSCERERRKGGAGKIPGFTCLRVRSQALSRFFGWLAPPPSPALDRYQWPGLTTLPLVVNLHPESPYLAGPVGSLSCQTLLPNTLPTCSATTSQPLPFELSLQTSFHQHSDSPLPFPGRWLSLLPPCPSFLSLLLILDPACSSQPWAPVSLLPVPLDALVLDLGVESLAAW